MRLPVAGESAAQLPWLWPDAHSVAALAQPLSAETWLTLRRDPAALLLCCRHSLSIPNPTGAITVLPARFLDPRLLETVLQWFRHDRGYWVDWRQPTVLPVYQTALAIAHHARIIAALTGACDSKAAWTAGLLVPLGWFAVAAVDPLAVADCRTDCGFAEDPSETQQRHWGLDHAAIARRLLRHWQLPDWLRLAVGHVDLPIESAAFLGVDPALFATVQLAVGIADHAGYSLGLIPDLEPEPLLKRLAIGVSVLRTVRERFDEVDLGEAFYPGWADPRQIGELPAVLEQAVESRKSEAASFLGPLECDVDRLHSILVHWKNGEEERVRTAKLTALAEFAAGASHEINNPLAVISGQSQYLLQREIEDDLRPALESIVRQTKRIHAILTDLMQFARPPQMTRRPTDLCDVIRVAIESSRGLAAEAGVDLDHAPVPPALCVDADPRHLQTAIGCLLRNAIEAAAPEKGWVRIRVECMRERVYVVVEDSGPGPTAAQREHLFDPFYSGRSAGRGRGLGLPTAWRLAREHGGDVRYVPTPAGPTQFVLSLPLLESAAKPLRLSA